MLTPPTRLQQCTCSYYAGTNLSLLKKEISKDCLFFKEHGHKTSLIAMLVIQQTVLELLGDANDHEAYEAAKLFVRESNSRLLAQNL